MEPKRESKDIKTKKAIIEALEDKPKFLSCSLVGGFMAIMIGNIMLNKGVEVSMGEN